MVAAFVQLGQSANEVFEKFELTDRDIALNVISKEYVKDYRFFGTIRSALKKLNDKLKLMECKTTGKYQ